MLRNEVNFKALTFLSEQTASTFNYEVKGTRAIWDPSLSIPGQTVVEVGDALSVRVMVVRLLTASGGHVDGVWRDASRTKLPISVSV